MADFTPKPPTKTSALDTAARAAKVLFLVIGIASTAILTARFAFPARLSCPIPKLTTSFLAPSYLFVILNFIIIVIWKLHQNYNPEEAEAVEITAPAAAAEVIPVQDPTEPVDNDEEWPPPENKIKQIIIEEEEETTEYSPSASSPSSSSIDATWKAIMASKSCPAPEKQLKKSDTWERTSHAPAPMSPLARASPAALNFNKELNTVPKKQMRKSKTFKESSSTSSAGWRGRDVLVVNHDELFRKVESFIKMNYEQMRLKRRESEQRRYMEQQMPNAAY